MPPTAGGTRPQKTANKLSTRRVELSGESVRAAQNCDNSDMYDERPGHHPGQPSEARQESDPDSGQHQHGEQDESEVKGQAVDCDFIREDRRLVDDFDAEFPYDGVVREHSTGDSGQRQVVLSRDAEPENHEQKQQDQCSDPEGEESRRS